MAGVIASTVPLAAVNFLVRDLLAKRDPMERYAAHNAVGTMRDFVDRAGFLSWMSPFADAATKFLGVADTNGSRYSQNSGLDSLMGTQFSQLNHLNNLFNQSRDLIKGAPGSSGDKVAGAAAAVAPFGMYARMVHTLFSDPPMQH